MMAAADGRQAAGPAARVVRLLLLQGCMIGSRALIWVRSDLI